MRESPLLTKIKFEPTFFQVLWRFVFSLPLFGEASGKGDSVFALPPAEPVYEIGSDIFKYTPPRLNRFAIYYVAEGVGLEPTSRLLHRPRFSKPLA